MSKSNRYLLNEHTTRGGSVWDSSHPYTSVVETDDRTREEKSRGRLWSTAGVWMSVVDGFEKTIFLVHNCKSRNELRTFGGLCFTVSKSLL